LINNTSNKDEIMDATTPSPTTTPADTTSALTLSPLAERFVLHWGEMGSRWGVNRTVSQIHALLFYIGTPLAADEIAATLNVARSNVSNSLKELQNWNLIKIVHLMGDRRDHFETSSDVWALFRTVVEERKQREFDPTITLLRECVADPTFKGEDKSSQLRLKESLALMETLSVWANEMLRLEPSTLLKVMKLGAKIQGLVRGTSSSK
jgi:DNA-binding transcriptional regulator GbsR (MarR family)